MVAIYLVFVACLSSAECQEFELPWDGSIVACSIFGQHRISDWNRDNPRYRPPEGGWRYRCANGKAA